MERRDFLKTSATGALIAALAGTGLLAGTSGASAEEFSFDLLTARMRERAAQAFQPTEISLPEAIANLDYDGHRAIRFLPERSVWKGQAPFEIQAFHLGWLFKEPVRIYSVENGQAAPMPLSPQDFEYREPLDPAAFEGVELPGIAGFRIHNELNRPGVMDELVSFLGASYFRALGRGSVYGLSARGLAINTATDRGEEFPRFDAFWVERPAERADEIKVWASMDSPSLTGAFELIIRPGDETVMEVTSRIFLRQDIQRLGVAPLTSMFLFARNNRSAFRDFRNGVHDSDGLKIIRQGGEEIWRSLNNPARLAHSFFLEDNPRGFGLYQRDRGFENYQDSEASYERRPSALIEPLNDWGRGYVTLIEIPTELEVNDNIVAFWVPEGEKRAGQEFEYRYRMRWGTLAESTGTLARVSALRAGEGGVAGVENSEPLQKFVLDFDGGPLSELGADDTLESTVRVNNAQIVGTTLSRIAANGMWRLVIDIGSVGRNPVELSAFLTLGGTRISEIWLYQWRVEDDRAG